MRNSIFEFGSVYCDDIAYIPGTRYLSGDIKIGDSNFMHKIKWIMWKPGIFVAAECVLTNVPHDELRFSNYLTGTVVQIDGNPYLCRCIKGGPRIQKGGKVEPNEWDSFLTEIDKEAKEAIPMQDPDFWAQEVLRSSGADGKRAIRLGVIRGNQQELSFWSLIPTDEPKPTAGFRPIIERLNPLDIPLKAPIGTQLEIFCDNCVITGSLAARSDYDIIVISDAELPKNCAWAFREDDKLVISRSAASWVREKRTV